MGKNSYNPASQGEEPDHTDPRQVERDLNDDKVTSRQQGKGSKHGGTKSKG